MWLPLPAAQGYKAQALRVLNKTFFTNFYFISFNFFLQKNFCPKSLTALSTPQQQWLSFFFFSKKLMARSVSEQF